MAHITGNGNEHEILAWPNMQVIRRHPELGHWIGCVVCLDRLEMELTPQSVNVLLVVVHPGKLHKVVANSRMGTISANHEIKGDVNLLVTRLLGRFSVSDFKPSFASAIVCACKLVVEEQLDVGHVV